MQAPLTTFSCFPEFPKEIRLLIWESLAWTPRTVIMCTPRQATWAWLYREIIIDNRKKEQSLYTHKLARAVGWTTLTPKPGMLQANRESRKVALEAFTLAFGWFRLPPTVWINFDADFVLLTCRDSITSGHPFGSSMMRYTCSTTPDVSKIRRLMTCDWKRMFFDPHHKPTFMPSLEVMEKITICETWREQENDLAKKHSPLHVPCAWHAAKRLVRKMTQARKQAARHPLISCGNACFVTEKPRPNQSDSSGLDKPKDTRPCTLLIETFIYGDDRGSYRWMWQADVPGREKSLPTKWELLSNDSQDYWKGVTRFDGNDLKMGVGKTALRRLCKD